MGTDRPAAMLRGLLDAAGYRLEDRPVGLLAVRRSDGRSLLLVDGDRSPAELEPEFPKDVLHRTLIYSDDPGPAARELAAQRGIEILGPTALGPALGELLLPGPSRPIPPQAEGSSRELEMPAQVLPEGERAVRPRISQQDAEARSGVEASREVLRLVPFFVAPYRVRVPSAGGGPGLPSDHVVAVNAITRQVEVWEANEREIVSPIEEEATRLAPRIGLEEARALAEAAIRRRHTQSVDHTEQLGGVTVIERRRLPPGPGDLKIGAAALVYVPYWYIESSDGRVVVDAVTGLRVAESESEPPA